MHTLPNKSRLPEDADEGEKDYELLRRVGMGEQAAIAGLFDLHSISVYSVALRVCRDPAQAEGIVQELFMRLWLAPEQFKGPGGSLEGKLALAARNLALERERLGQPGKPSEARLPGRELNPLAHEEINQLMRHSHSLILLLPDADRQVLEMAFFDGKTPGEIALATGVQAGEVTGRLRNALSALRSETEQAARFGTDTGLEVTDLDADQEFAGRRLPPRDVTVQMEGLRRLTHSFVQSPETILQELVNAAVELCGADSAGISVEGEAHDEQRYWHWVATAGQYNGFMNAVLPRYPSACGICLERARPQLFRVSQRFFDIMGIEAPLVTDGILLPWQTDETRGTIFIMAHGRRQAFDRNDGQMMRVLADVAAMAVRHRKQTQALLEQAQARTAVAVAENLQRQMKAPMQGLQRVADRASGEHGDAKVLGRELSSGLLLLSAAVADALRTPKQDA